MSDTQQESLWTDERIGWHAAKNTRDKRTALYQHRTLVAMRDQYEARLRTVEQELHQVRLLVSRLEAEDNSIIGTLRQERDEWRQRHAECTTSLITADRQIAQLKRDRDEALEALKLAYRKHHLGDESIGWSELSDHMLNALCETMGDEAYLAWSAQYGKGESDE